MSAPDEEDEADTGVGFDQPTTQLSAVKVKEIIEEHKPCSLKMVEGPSAPREIQLMEKEITVGRGSKAQISILSPTTAAP